MVEAASVAVVFDFDQTLSAEEIGMYHDHSNMMERGFGGAHRVEQLRRLLHRLQQGGALLFIVSYNSKKVICKALQIVGLAAYFDAARIFGRETWECQRGSGRWSKAAVVRDEIVAPLALPPQGLLFVDDDPAHCHDVAAAFPDARVIAVPREPRNRRAGGLPRGGVQPAHLEAICGWAKARGAYVGSPPAEGRGPASEPEGGPADPVGPEGETQSTLAFAPKRSAGPLAAWQGGCVRRARADARTDMDAARFCHGRTQAPPSSKSARARVEPTCMRGVEQPHRQFRPRLPQLSETGADALSVAHRFLAGTDQTDSIGSKQDLLLREDGKRFVLRGLPVHSQRQTTDALLEGP
ncbi:hypothetical protein AB1Y20_010732 [Prymnesium parvum]|uniref:FCP1 homology domain-containing protein n=1 Tax=Prymnesium parvum TaxID=97485 RepID=A0AB34ISC2_PRYPA